ncbi:hypothetical protein ASG11_00240 [Sphingomonas sp. Leaf357]|nr:hypothetical protein ASG11_00240 [Sphingomonas sp. Leaf357]
MTPTVARVDMVAAQSKLAGEVLVAKGDTVVLDKGYGSVAPGGKTLHKAGGRWRLASITKQIVATYLVASYATPAARPGAMDMPLGETLDRPSFGGVSVRQLLTHHSGLANADDTPKSPGGVPDFYLKPVPDLAYCISKPAVPNSPFSYNNCDYIVAGAALVGDSDDMSGLWPKGMAMARPGEMAMPGFVSGKAEPHYELAAFGFAGGLIGTAHSVFDFDRALMTGKILSPVTREELWKPEGNGSYQALGQWVFPGQLKGCAKPKRIVQRDGEIGGVQTRNFIFPEDDLVVIVFANRSSDDFRFGEVWEGKGFTYDLLSAAACS